MSDNKSDNKWLGITSNKVILMGVVDGDPNFVENDGKSMVLLNLVVKCREQELNGQWKDSLISVPILDVNEKRVDKLMKPYVQNGRELYVEGYYLPWDGGHAIVLKEVNLGSKPKDGQDPPPPQDRKYWNVCLNEAHIIGAMDEVSTTLMGDHTVATLTLTTEVTEYTDGQFSKRLVPVPIIVFEESKVKVVTDTAQVGQTLAVHSYYKSFDGGHGMVAKQILLGNRPYPKSNKPSLPSM